MNAKVSLFLALMAVSLWSSQAAPPAHCLEAHPKGYGLCDMLEFGFFFNPASNNCEQWQEVGCGVEGGRNYNTVHECVKDCIEPVV